MRDRLRVLVCDHEPQSVRALRVVLGNAGFEVDATTRAGDALVRATVSVTDAAIIEPALPDGDGVELCRRFAMCARTAAKTLYGRRAA